MTKNKSRDKNSDPSSIPLVDDHVEKVTESFRKRYNLKPGQDFKVVLKKRNTDKKG